MSYVMAAPEMMAAAAMDVAAVGSTLSAAHMAATAPTVAVMPAAADEVSGSIAHLFSRHAQDYQALAGRAAVFHEQFVQHLNASVRSYAAAEAANAASLQPLNASASSSASAIAALPGPLAFNLLTSVNAALGQLLNIWNMFTSRLIAFLNALYDLAYFVYILAYLAYIPIYILERLWGPLYVFGVRIWI
ncbi:MAG TPA: PE family protein [Mycobacterium sp.]|nr:PE family protein [Mycobacterium sp.]